MKLNKLQQEAVDAFLSGESIVLTGRAGTGKSAVINAIKSYGPVLITATTNKAAILLDGITIHKALAIPFGDVRDIHGREKHARVGKDDAFSKSQVQKHKNLIIDEASMLDSKIYNSLNKQLGLEHTVMFVGDDGQLPPVDGPNIFQNDIKVTYRTIELTEVFRQKDGSLLDYASSIYKKTAGTYLPITHDIHKKDFVKQYPVKALPGFINKYIGKMHSDIQFIAPTNETCANVNTLSIKLNKQETTPYNVWIDRKNNVSVRVPLKIGTPLIYSGRTNHSFVKNQICSVEMRKTEEVKGLWEQYQKLRKHFDIDLFTIEETKDLSKGAVDNPDLKDIYLMAYQDYITLMQEVKEVNSLNQKEMEDTAVSSMGDRVDAYEQLLIALAPIPKVEKLSNLSAENKIAETQKLSHKLKEYTDYINEHTSSNKSNMYIVNKINDIISGRITVEDKRTFRYDYEQDIYSSEVWKRTFMFGEDVLQDYCKTVGKPTHKILSDIFTDVLLIEKYQEYDYFDVLWEQIEPLISQCVINPFKSALHTIPIYDTFDRQGREIIYQKTKELVKGTNKDRLVVTGEYSEPEDDLGSYLTINGSYVNQYDLETLFKPAYCLTVHKTQGSQYKHVAIVLNSQSDVKYLWNKIDGLEYTAITRTEKTITLFTSFQSEQELNK